ncbi:MAG TPA: Ldh family oxidoreductase [Alphaproteobacteria bacterium]|nr:Ldh family oxidoreductase [Alphaproteobacteria bacterium]
MTALSLVRAHGLAVRALVAAGATVENAEAVARALVAAEADGLAGHGLSRVPAYADQAVAGKVDGRASPTLRQTAPAVLVVDAADGFAFPAIALGLAQARILVRDTGVCALAVTNSHHFGAAGYHVEPLAADGLAALVFGNSPAGIAPWGGRRAIFGTNPIAFACPRRGAPPLVIDLSLSKVARGKIMVAAQKGEAIPEGWALDAEGRPTTDAKAALAGTMLPMGDAKGYALVLMAEILAAALTGARFGYEASSFFDAKGPPPRVGQFFLIFDPIRFVGHGFAQRVAELANAILAQPGARLPGERRLKLRAKAAVDGLVIPDALYDELVRRAG